MNTQLKRDFQVCGLNIKYMSINKNKKYSHVHWNENITELYTARMCNAIQ